MWLPLEKSSFLLPRCLFLNQSRIFLWPHSRDSNQGTYSSSRLSFVHDTDTHGTARGRPITRAALQVEHRVKGQQERASNCDASCVVPM